MKSSWTSVVKQWSCGAARAVFSSVGCSRAPPTASVLHDAFFESAGSSSSTASRGSPPTSRCCCACSVVSSGCTFASSAANLAPGAETYAPTTASPPGSMRSTCSACERIHPASTLAGLPSSCGGVGRKRTSEAPFGESCARSRPDSIERFAWSASCLGVSRSSATESM